MPFPNYHAARLQNPDKYDSFKTTKGGKIYGKITVPETINVVWGKIGTDVVVPQALRFNKASWSVAVAKKWLADHRVKYKTFEPAKEAKKMADEEEIKLDDDYEVEHGIGLTVKELGEMDDMALGTWVRKKLEAQMNRKRLNISLFGDEQNKKEDKGSSTSTSQSYDYEYCPKKMEADETNSDDQDTDEVADPPASDDEDAEEFGETFALKARPIFGICTAHEVDYELADLKEIVANFTRFKGKVIPPLKLGHPDQDFVKKGMAKEKGTSSGMPAAGWVDRIWIEGKQILADFRDIPKRIYDLLVKKAYDRISVELYPNFTYDDGKQYGKTLAAVAVLGTDAPAIKSLPAIEARYSEDVDRNDEIVTIFYEEVSDMDTDKEITEEETTESETKTETESPPKEEAKTETTEVGGDDDMENVLENQLKFQEMSAKLAKLEQNLTDATTIIDLQQSQMGEQKTEARKEKEKVILSELKEAGKWLPANDEKIIRLFDAVADIKTVVKFTEDQDGESVEVEKRPYDMVIDILGALPKAVDFSEHAEGGEEEKKPVDSEFANDVDRNGKPAALDGMELHQQIEEYAEKNQVSYADALLAISK